jgi:cell division protein FtsB
MKKTGAGAPEVGEGAPQAPDIKQLLASNINLVYPNSMKPLMFLALLVFAVVTTVLSLVGGGSFPRVASLETSLEAQRKKNLELQAEVQSLQEKVYAVRHDARGLEKAARNELGLARPDELVVIFDKKSPQANE